MSFDPFDFKNTLPIINEDSEFFPLMSSEDEEEMNNEELPRYCQFYHYVILYFFRV